jgi:NADH-quinone oxidoreductase subunit L
MNPNAPNLYLWLIPLLPLVGAAINGIFGRSFPKNLVKVVGLVFVGAAFLLAAITYLQFRQLPLSSIPIIEEHLPWITVPGDFRVDFSFYLDQLSMVMILVVTGVGFLIHVYSVAYMEHEGGYYRFFSYLNLFMFFMLTLVLASSYLLMFVGWEGVGLASYLLIGFFFTKDSAANAGKKAFIVNRIGDFGFLIAMFLLFKSCGSLNFKEIFVHVQNHDIAASTLTAIALLLMLGAAGKSAQIPLYVWLPDAMEGPTPVSALIHAATMVTAGVYMVARSHVIFNESTFALSVVAAIGAMTALFAATIGMAQTDIKRVLAYSTISQLGYMFMACGVAAYSAGIFHLMTHAFFKALLFLSAGSVIHALGGEQDMRYMGGLWKKIPWTFGTMTAGTFAIAGFFPLAGFFSKDEILFQDWENYGSKIIWFVGLMAAGITSFYMFRLWFMTFFGERREAEQGAGHDDHEHASNGDHVHESPWMMLGPLVILAALSVAGGWVNIPRALGGHTAFDHFLAPVFNAGAEKAEPEAPGLELELAGASVAVAAAGLGLAWLFYYKRRDLPGKITAALNGFYTLVRDKYRIDELYNWLFVQPVIKFSRNFLWQQVDVATIDGLVNEMGDSARVVSNEARKMQSGNIRSYAGWVALGAAAVVAYMIWVGLR